jgi:hypothetical protein
MASLIPEAWRKTVCGILKSGDRSRIELKRRALNEWNAATNHTFLYELYSAIEDALNDTGIEGKKHVMDEPGETYAFFFMHERQRMYSKICLCPDGTVIIVYSAHLPNKETL